MPSTNFPYGLSSYGAPVLPSVPVGHDSKYYYVDSVYGNDGNDGSSPEVAMKTVEAAYAKLRSGRWDGIFLIGCNTAYTLASSLTWSADHTFLIGLTAPIQVAQRARITNGLSTNLMTPMVQFTGTGIIVKNINFNNGGSHATSAAVSVLLYGAQRCYFENCHFIGGSGALASADASCRSLVLDGGAAGAGQGENLFVGCTVGTDTIVRGNAANTEIEFKNFATRNIFKDCLIIRNGGAGGSFVKVGASGLQRFAMFKDCVFHNDGTAITNAFSVDAAPNGNVLLVYCVVVGLTNVPANAKIFTEPLDAATTSVLKGVSPT